MPLLTSVFKNPLRILLGSHSARVLCNFHRILDWLGLVLTDIQKCNQTQYLSLFLSVASAPVTRMRAKGIRTALTQLIVPLSRGSEILSSIVHESVGKTIKGSEQKSEQITGMTVSRVAR